MKKLQFRQTAITKTDYGMPGKHYIDSCLIKHVVLLTNQKDYVHYPARATGHHIFEFLLRYAKRSTLYAVLYTQYGMLGKHYIDSYLIKHVVLLTNQKDYVHYPIRATGHHNFDFFYNTLNAVRCSLYAIRYVWQTLY